MNLGVVSNAGNSTNSWRNISFSRSTVADGGSVKIMQYSQIQFVSRNVNFLM
jgi:hypothetical protein